MKNRNVLVLAGSVFFALALFGCARQEASQEPSNYPDALIVADGAFDVVYDRNRGASQVRYMLDTPYPADGFIAEIGRQLSQRGWRPLEADFMNPDVPTAHVAGWQERADYGTRPPSVVYEWNGEWENAARDILVYALSYRPSKEAPGDLARMSIVAVHIPKAAADKAKAHVDKF